MSGFYIIAVITCIVIGASWIYKRKCKKSQEPQPQPAIECTSAGSAKTWETPATSYIALRSAPPAEDDPSDPR